MIVKNAYCTFLPLIPYLASSNLPTLNIIPPRPHCFHYMTISQMLSPINKYLAFAFSISAAFNTLDHSILFHRISTWFGICELPLQWLTSYVSSHTSAVSFPPHLSPSEPLIFGVPQGSVMGPIIFNLFTSHLLLVSHPSHNSFM